MQTCGSACTLDHKRNQCQNIRLLYQVYVLWCQPLAQVTFTPTACGKGKNHIKRI